MLPLTGFPKTGTKDAMIMAAMTNLDEIGLEFNKGERDPSRIGDKYANATY